MKASVFLKAGNYIIGNSVYRLKGCTEDIPGPRCLLYEMHQAALRLQRRKVVKVYAKFSYATIIIETPISVLRY